MRRFETLLKMRCSDKINGVAGTGHSYAMRSAGRGLTAAAALTEKMAGYEYLQLLKECVEADKFQAALEAIREIATLVLNKRRMRCALNDTIENMEDALKSAEIFVSALNGKPLKMENR